MVVFSYGRAKNIGLLFWGGVILTKRSAVSVVRFWRMVLEYLEGFEAERIREVLQMSSRETGPSWAALQQRAVEFPSSDSESVLPR